MKLPPPPWIAAHRGSLPLLENTIPALARAVEEGADLLEFDVQATADDTLVLCHDADLGRLAGRPELAVEQALWRELEAVELRHPERPEATGRIPTLAALLTALPHGFPVNIELKVHRTDRERLAGLALAATSGRENVLFSSFDTALLRALRRLAPTARVAPLARRWTPGLAALGEELGAWSLNVTGGVARARQARTREGIAASAAIGAIGAIGASGAGAAGAAPGAGPPLLVYTVNDAARARRLFDEGAAGVFSDRPAPLRAELGALGESGVLSTAYRG